MASSRSNSTTRVQQSPKLQGTTAMVGNMPVLDISMAREVDYLQDKVQLEADFQVLWDHCMSDDKYQSSYKQVYVLLLSWHPECDDMGVDDEVTRLGALFEDIYNFHVTSVKIDSREKRLPQTQASLAVINLVAEHDSEDALFIVYYAGHARLGKNMGDLDMSGRRIQNKKNIAKEFSHITWNHVEGNLKTTKADVFLIFDCCHASDLGRESPLNSRSFEYLAASTSAYTRSPGEASFTSALIWALKKLAQAPTKTPMFTTSKLAKMVCDAPGFPEDQKPSLTTRDLDSYHHIVLAPLPKVGEGASTELDNQQRPSLSNDEEMEDHDSSQDRHSLSLTFHFRSEQDASDIQKLATHLLKFKKFDNKDLHQIQWGGIWGGTGKTRRHPGHRFREAVSKLLARETHKNSRQSSLSPTTPRDIIIPSSPIPENSNSRAPSVVSITERTALLFSSSSNTIPEYPYETILDRILCFFQLAWKPRNTSANTVVSTTSQGRPTSWITRLFKKMLTPFRSTPKTCSSIV